MEKIDLWINLAANLVTIIAACTAVFLFFFNLSKIKSAFKVILNYSIRLSLSDLKNKIESLNYQKSYDSAQKVEIINILNEIVGHINGNKFLKEKLDTQLKKINRLIAKPDILSEPLKRNLIAELRESINNIDASNYQEFINSKNK